MRCDASPSGFGPELFGRTDKHGTRWKFSLIPLGGYVKMFGEGETMQVVEGGKTTEIPRELTPEEKLVSFRHKTLGQRAAIVFAGPCREPHFRNPRLLADLLHCWAPSDRPRYRRRG